MVTLPEDQFLDNLGLFGLDRTKAQEALDGLKNTPINNLQKGTADEIGVLLKKGNRTREVSEKDIFPALMSKGLDQGKTLEAFLDMKSARVTWMQASTRQKVNAVVPNILPVAVPVQAAPATPQEKEYEDSDAGEFERIADKVDNGIVTGMDEATEAFGKPFTYIKNKPKKAIAITAGAGAVGALGTYTGMLSLSLLPNIAVGAGIAGLGLYLRKKLQKSGYQKLGNFVGGVGVGSGILTGAGMTFGAPMLIGLAGIGYGGWKAVRYGLPAIFRFFQKRQERQEAKESPSPSP